MNASRTTGGGIGSESNEDDDDDDDDNEDEEGGGGFDCLVYQCLRTYILNQTYSSPRGG